MANKKTEQEHQLVISALDKSKATFKGIQSSLSSLSKTVNGVKGKLAGVGVALSTASFASLIKGAIQATAQLKKFQIQTGLSAEAISGINYITGGEVEGVAKAMGHLAKSAYAARAGGAEARATFDALGITFSKTGGQLKSAEQLFADTAGAIARLPNEMERAALAEKVFGKSYQEVLPLLMRGSNVFNSLAADARKYGVVLSQDVIDSSSKFVKETQKISRVLDSGSKVWAAKLAPGLSIIATAIQETIQAQSDLQSKGKILEGDGALANWAKTGITMITGMIDIVDLLKRSFMVVGTVIGNYAGFFISTATRVAATFSNIGEGVMKASAGNFSAAKALFAKAGSEVKGVGSDISLFFSKTADDVAATFNSPRMSESFSKFGQKALSEHQKLVDKQARIKAGTLTAEEKFSEKMLNLQKALAKGMQAQLAIQIAAVEKLEKKLTAAKEKQKNVKDDFAAARDELQYGSTAKEFNPDGSKATAKSEISNVLDAGAAAAARGKYDVADKEARKVIGMLEQAKSSAAGELNAANIELGTLRKSYQELDAQRTALSDKSGTAYNSDEYTQITRDMNDLSAKMRSVKSDYDSRKLSSGDADGFLNQAEKLAGDAATAQVASLQKQVDEINKVIDGLDARLKRLSNLEIDFQKDNALKNVNDMMSLLQRAIDKEPLVITAVRAKLEDSSVATARGMVADNIKDFGRDAELNTPNMRAPEGTKTLNYAPAPDVATQEALRPINVSLNGTTFPMYGGGQTTTDLINAAYRDKLKSGQ